MWCFDHDRGITHREGLGELSNWRRISDEVDDNGLSAAANIELCEGGCRAQRVDAHARGLQCVAGVGNEGSEGGLVVKEQIEIAVSRCLVWNPTSAAPPVSVQGGRSPDGAISTCSWKGDSLLGGTWQRLPAAE
jgi:hypothetical protein